MRLIAEQKVLRPQLPRVIHAEYRAYERQFKRIDELLRTSGIEEELVAAAVAEWMGGNQRRPSGRRQARYQQYCRLSLRCTIARQLTEKEFRRFSLHLAESPLLQWFCGIGWLELVKPPSKSTLERFEKQWPAAAIGKAIDQLNCAAAGLEGVRHPLGLEEEISLEMLWADTTCLKANIHFPVDWVLLRDAARTLVKGMLLIRRHGLKHRMPEPERFLRQMNQLSMAMTQCRRAPGSIMDRKRVLRQMKRLSGVIKRHGWRYVKMLKARWEETDWSEGQARQVWQRMEGVLAQLPAALKQAHERIIGRRPVANADKILSLYEHELHVIVRGKAQAEIEFGNTLFLAEQAQGLILDWKLLREQSSGDAELLDVSLRRQGEMFGQYPSGVGADRGFDRQVTRDFLEAHAIYNGICPRALKRLRELRGDKVFEALQRRRAQTEGRIGILQNNFFGRPLLSKGFGHREIAVAWAILAHNLWVLARLPLAEEQVRKKAA